MAAPGAPAHPSSGLTRKGRLRSKSWAFVQESLTSFAGNSRVGIYTDLEQEAIMATRILLVDDDPNIISLLRQGLAYEGFEVYTAMDGESGLVAVEKCLPHIMLVDITMPGLDGFELCRRLQFHDNIAIIMLTARDAVANKVNALNLGADDYVPKPFAFDELVARIPAVLH